jgi:hypothetical protein
MHYKMRKSDENNQLQPIAISRDFNPVNLLMTCFGSVERILWTEATGKTDTDTCELTELFFEDGLKNPADFNFDLNQLFGRYPLGIQHHLEHCPICQPRLLELVQVYHRSQLSFDSSALLENYQAELKKHPPDEFGAYHAALRSNLGNVFLLRYELKGQPEDLKEAILSYRLAKEFYNQQPQSLEHAVLMNNIATGVRHYARLKEQPAYLRQALDYYHEALTIFKQRGNQIPRAIINNNLANTLMECFEISQQPENLEQALLNYRVALETCQSPQYSAMYALICRNKATAQVSNYRLTNRLSDWEKAYSLYQRAIAFFNQNSLFSYDARLANHDFEQLLNFRTRASRVISEVTLLAKNSREKVENFYVRGNWSLGVLRLGGLIEAEASILWRLKNPTRRLSYDQNGLVTAGTWELYLKLQPLLVRSNRLRLNLTLPADPNRTAGDPDYPSWTSAWYNFDQTNPLEIELPNRLEQLLGCHELHWQIEEIPNLTTVAWQSGYLTWQAALSKVTGQATWFNPEPEPIEDWFTPTLEDRSEPAFSTIESGFELLNLSEDGVKLEVNVRQIAAAQFNFNLRLLNTGIATGQDYDLLSQVYEVMLLDHEGQTLLNPLRLKIEEEHTVILALPDEMTDATGLEFRVRRSDYYS